MVVRNLLEHFVAHGKTSFTPAVFPRKRESYNPKIGVPTQVVGERYKWFVLSPWERQWSEREAPRNADFIGLNRAAAKAAARLRPWTTSQAIYHAARFLAVRH